MRKWLLGAYITFLAHHGPPWLGLETRAERAERIACATWGHWRETSVRGNGYNWRAR